MNKKTKTAVSSRIPILIVIVIAETDKVALEGTRTELCMESEYPAIEKVERGPVTAGGQKTKAMTLW